MIGARAIRAARRRAAAEPVRAIYAVGLIAMAGPAARALQYYRRNPNG